MAIRVAAMMMIGLSLICVSSILGIWSMPQCWGLAEWSQVVACGVVGTLGCAGISVTNSWRGEVASELFRVFWFLSCLALAVVMFHNAWSWTTGGWFWFAAGQPVSCG